MYGITTHFPVAAFAVPISLIALEIVCIAGIAVVSMPLFRKEKKRESSMNDQTPLQFPGNGEPNMEKPMFLWTDAEWNEWWKAVDERMRLIMNPGEWKRMDGEED